MSVGKTAIAGIALCLAQSATATDRLQEVCGDCVVEKVAECGGFLEGATVSPDGTLWAMDLLGDRVLEIRDGTCINRGSGGTIPSGAKFRPDGTVFIANSQGLVSFDPATAEITPIFTEFDGEAVPSTNDLAVDEDGGVYLTEVRGSSLLNPVGRVYYLPPHGGEIQILAEGLAFPNGIALTNDGTNVLVSEFAAKRVISIPTAAPSDRPKISYVYATTAGGVGADGIHLDTLGRLYTAQIGAGTIQVFSPAGRPLGDIELPAEAGNLVTNVAEAAGYLYITEAGLGEIWRVKLNTP